MDMMRVLPKWQSDMFNTNVADAAKLLSTGFSTPGADTGDPGANKVAVLPHNFIAICALEGAPVVALRFAFQERTYVLLALTLEADRIVYGSSLQGVLGHWVCLPPEFVDNYMYSRGEAPASDAAIVAGLAKSYLQTVVGLHLTNYGSNVKDEASEKSFLHKLTTEATSARLSAPYPNIQDAVAWVFDQHAKSQATTAAAIKRMAASVRKRATKNT
jgi:hypothetical protein